MKKRIYFLFAPMSILVIAALLSSGSSIKDTKQFQVLFYNVENLFDTIDDPATHDGEFTPEGQKHWTGYRYYNKLNQLFKVFASAGKANGPDIIGLAEIENYEVLNDLVYSTPLHKHNYGIVHKNSPDRRGIDVALLYKKDRLRLVKKEFVNVTFDFDTSRTTRDILKAGFVSDKFKRDDTLIVFVNHWPSRWGGKQRSEPSRMAAARVLREAVNECFKNNAGAHIIIMGDFNDTPADKSVNTVLNAHATNVNVSDTGLYNLAWPLHQSGAGSHKYKGQWAMLDQIIVSGNLLIPLCIHVKNGMMHIYSPTFLMEEDTRFTGIKPFRTFNGFHYHKGYSDHLPVYVELLAK